MSTQYRLVHDAMRKKLGITGRAVNMRRAKLQSLVGMPDDIARSTWQLSARAYLSTSG